MLLKKPGQDFVPMINLLLSAILQPPFRTDPKELARRGHKFVRYADDCMILCRSKRAAARVRESISTFIESRLHLKVNRDKTGVAYVGRVKYLGYSFYMVKGKCRLRLHPKSVAKMKARLKVLTSRNNGWGYAKLKGKLNRFINGWMNYFKLADMRNILQTTDYVWKSWKKVGTKFRNLMKCGIDRWRAWQWANTSNCISTKEPPYAERHVGGVRSVNTKVGDKCL